MEAFFKFSLSNNKNANRFALFFGLFPFSRVYINAWQCLLQKNKKKKNNTNWHYENLNTAYILLNWKFLNLSTLRVKSVKRFLIGSLQCKNFLLDLYFTIFAMKENYLILSKQKKSMKWNIYNLALLSMYVFFIML